MAYKLYERTDFASNEQIYTFSKNTTNYDGINPDIDEKTISYSIQIMGAGGNGAKAFESYSVCRTVNDSGKCTQWDAWGDTFPGGGGAGGYYNIECPILINANSALTLIECIFVNSYTKISLTYSDGYKANFLAFRGNDAAELVPNYALLENSGNDENVPDVNGYGAPGAGTGLSTSYSIDYKGSNNIRDYCTFDCYAGTPGGNTDAIGTTNSVTSSGSGFKSKKSIPYGTPQIAQLPTGENTYMIIQGGGEKNPPSQYGGGGTSTIDGYMVNDKDVTTLYRTGGKAMALIRKNTN